MPPIPRRCLVAALAATLWATAVKAQAGDPWGGTRQPEGRPGTCGASMNGGAPVGRIRFAVPQNAGQSGPWTLPRKRPELLPKCPDTRTETCSEDCRRGCRVQCDDTGIPREPQPLRNLCIHRCSRSCAIGCGCGYVEFSEWVRNRDRDPVGRDPGGG